jgi:hypothetical protein
MKTINRMEIQSQEQWVLYRLEKVLSNAENFDRVKNIIDGKSKISLRLIDWFVTKLFKKIQYNIRNKKSKTYDCILVV